MNKEIIGFLETDANEPLAGLRVGVQFPGSLFFYKGFALAFTVTDNFGRFQLSVRRSPAQGIRELEIVAYDKAGRELTFAPPTAASRLRRHRRRAGPHRGSNRTKPQENFGDFIIREADATGRWTTLGTGEAVRFQPRQPRNDADGSGRLHMAAAMMRYARRKS